MSPGLLKSLVILRYIVLIACAGWAGGAAAIGNWGVMLFFLCYIPFLYFLGKIADSYRDKQKFL